MASQGLTMNELACEVQIVEKAYAKINLTLEVIGKRSDGFHRLASVMQTINLYDTVTFAPSDEIIISCDDDQISVENNLVSKTACLLKERLDVKNGANIFVRKSVPVAGGLGGGSADAAATLRGLNTVSYTHLTLQTKA